MPAGSMLGAREGGRRQTSEGGENPTGSKLNGSFGCWRWMSPSQGAKHLEQSGQVQTQSQRDGTRGASENGTASLAQGMALPQPF